MSAFASVTVSLLKLFGQVGSELYKLPCLARLRLELRRFLTFQGLYTEPVQGQFATYDMPLVVRAKPVLQCF